MRWLVRAFLRSCVRALVHSLVRTFVHARSFVRACVSFVRLFVFPLDGSFLCLFSFFHSLPFIGPYVCPFVDLRLQCKIVPLYFNCNFDDNDKYMCFFTYFSDKHFWTQGFVMVGRDKLDCVPLFLGELADDIFVCGKTINLLKLCCPEVCLF